MNEFIISIEDVCEVSKAERIKFNIEVAPMTYTINGVEFNSDDPNFLIDNICKQMREGAITKTSQISMQSAYDYFKKLISKNKNILHISFSSGMSATHDNFKRASEDINREYKTNIMVVDSLCQAGGINLILKMLTQKIETENFTIQQCKDFVDKIKLNVNHIFTVDNLKYLSKGGRISTATAIIGNIIQVKPILRLDNKGIIVSYQKVMGRKRAIQALFNKMKETFNNNSKFVYIAEADCKEDAIYLSSLIKNDFNIEPIIISLTPIITAHSGPGTLSLYFTANSR